MATIRQTAALQFARSTEKATQPTEQIAIRRIAAYGPHAFCFREVGLQFQGGVLTLTGRVPSFYLKQVLQTLLKGLEGVTRLDNRVDVVSPRGLSGTK